MTWQLDLVSDELKELKSLTIGVSRGLRDLQQRSDSSSSGKRPRLASAPGGERFFLETAAELMRVAGNAQGSAKLIEKAATTVATTSNSGWASELSKPGGVSGYLMGLTQSALASVLRRSPQISLVGEGQARVPIVGSVPPATIVGEGQPIPVIKGTVSSAAMAPWKIASLLTASEELLNAPNAESMLRAMLSKSVSAGLDAAAFSAVPPAGLLAGLTGLTPSAAAEPSIAVLEDLAALLEAMRSPSSETVFVMSPPSLVVASAWTGANFPYALLASSALPRGKIVAVDALGVAASLPAEARSSIVEGSAIHEDSAPGALVDPAGVVAAPIRSFFQTDTYGMRTIFEAAWAARPGAIAFMESVTW